MDLKYIKSTGESTSDSDYDTAVDLVHYRIDDFKYFFETKVGLKIVLSYYSTTTTKSYLEPDFDEIEEDYKNGTKKDHYAYHSHASEEPANSREELNMWIELPIEKIVLSIPEFEIYEKYVKNQTNYSTMFSQLNEKYTPELVYKLNFYDEQQQYCEPDRYPVTMSNEEMQIIYSSLMNNLKEKKFFNLDLPKHIEDQLLHYEIEHLRIEVENEENEPIQKENEIKAYENIANNKLFSESPLITGILKNDSLNNEEVKIIDLNNDNTTKTTIFSKIKKMFK